MSWEAIGAIAGIGALVITIIVEWPKIVERITGIPPITFSIFGVLLFQCIAMFGAGFGFGNAVEFIISNHNQAYSQSMYIFASINIGSNIILSIIINHLTKKFIHEEDKSFVFSIWALLIFGQMAVGFYILANPSSVFGGS